MSLRSMAVMRAEADQPKPTGQQADQTVLTKLRDQAIALIPAESLAVFLAAMSFVADEAYGIRWALFGVVALGTPLWVYGNYREKTKTSPTRRLPLLEMVVGTIAFAAWATTVPATPFLQIEGYKLEMGAAIVALAGFLLIPLVRFKAGWTPGGDTGDGGTEPAAAPG